MPFRSSTSKSAGRTRFTFTGSIDEMVDFPKHKLENEHITIDLKGVVSMNSIGTRAWCVWIAGLRSPSMIRLENCPPIMVKSFSTVVGVCPKNVEVISFYVPFISPQTGIRTELLLQKGVHYSTTGVLHIPKQLSPNGAELEMDVLPTYFKFLQK